MLSVLVPWSRPLNETRALLISLRRQTDQSFELILAINGEAKKITNEEWTTVLAGTSFRTKRVDSAEGANPSRLAAIRAAEGSHYFFLDDDTELIAQNAIAVAKKFTEIRSIYYGRYRDPGLRGLSKTYFEMSDEWVQAHQFVTAGCFVISRQLAFELSLFTQPIRFGGTELIMNSQFVREGIRKCHIQELDVWHHIRVSASEMVYKGSLQGAALRWPETHEAAQEFARTGIKTTHFGWRSDLYRIAFALSQRGVDVLSRSLILICLLVLIKKSSQDLYDFVEKWIVRGLGSGLIERVEQSPEAESHPLPQEPTALAEDY